MAPVTSSQQSAVKFITSAFGSASTLLRQPDGSADLAYRVAAGSGRVSQVSTFAPRRRDYRILRRRRRWRWRLRRCRRINRRRRHRSQICAGVVSPLVASRVSSGTLLAAVLICVQFSRRRVLRYTPIVVTSSLLRSWFCHHRAPVSPTTTNSTSRVKDINQPSRFLRRFLMRNSASGRLWRRAVSLLFQPPAAVPLLNIIIRRAYERIYPRIQ